MSSDTTTVCSAAVAAWSTILKSASSWLHVNTSWWLEVTSWFMLNVSHSSFTVTGREIHLLLSGEISDIRLSILLNHFCSPYYVEVSPNSNPEHFLMDMHSRSSISPISSCTFLDADFATGIHNDVQWYGLSFLWRCNMCQKRFTPFYIYVTWPQRAYTGHAINNPSCSVRVFIHRRVRLCN